MFILFGMRSYFYSVVIFIRSYVDIKTMKGVIIKEIILLWQRKRHKINSWTGNITDKKMLKTNYEHVSIYTFVATFICPLCLFASSLSSSIFSFLLLTGAQKISISCAWSYFSWFHGRKGKRDIFQSRFFGTR